MFFPVLLWDILCAERWKTPMSERSWLEWKKDWCQEQVYDLNKKIRDARNARESLEAFLRSVQNKQSEHLEAIGRKQNSVDRVTGSCKNCKVTYVTTAIIALAMSILPTAIRKYLLNIPGVLRCSMAKSIATSTTATIDCAQARPYGPQPNCILNRTASTIFSVKVNRDI